MLYEDQVGEFDWYQRYVGRVTQAVNRPRSRAGPDVLFVASDKNIVAALGADGQVMWKKVRRSVFAWGLPGPLSRLSSPIIAQTRRARVSFFSFPPGIFARSFPFFTYKQSLFQ